MLGMAVGRDMKGKKNNVIAVIGEDWRFLINQVAMCYLLALGTCC